MTLIEANKGKLYDRINRCRKASDKFQQPFMIQRKPKKPPKKPKQTKLTNQEQRRTSSTWWRIIYKNLSSIYLIVRELPIISTIQGYPLSPFLFVIIPSRWRQTRKRSKRYIDWEGRNKTSLFTNDTTISM